MPNFNDESPLFSAEKQAATSKVSALSKILGLCTSLETALAEFTAAQFQLDNEHWTSSPTANVEAVLRRIRAARRRCGKLADELLEMSPKTSQEKMAVSKVIKAYVAQVDTDRTTCNLRVNTALDSRWPDPGAASSETKSARIFPLNVTSWKGWSKVSFPPKPR